MEDFDEVLQSSGWEYVPVSTGGKELDAGVCFIEQERLSVYLNEVRKSIQNHNLRENLSQIWRAGLLDWGKM